MNNMFGANIYTENINIPEFFNNPNISEYTFYLKALKDLEDYYNSIINILHNKCKIEFTNLFDDIFVDILTSISVLNKQYELLKENSNYFIIDLDNYNNISSSVTTDFINAYKKLGKNITFLPELEEFNNQLTSQTEIKQIPDTIKSEFTDYLQESSITKLKDKFNYPECRIAIDIAVVIFKLIKFKLSDKLNKFNILKNFIISKFDESTEFGSKTKELELELNTELDTYYIDNTTENIGKLDINRILNSNSNLTDEYKSFINKFKLLIELIILY